MAGLDVVELLRELVGRVTVSGDAAPQRDAMGMVADVLRERAPHLEVTAGTDPDHPWTLLRTPTDPMLAASTTSRLRHRRKTMKSTPRIPRRLVAAAVTLAVAGIGAGQPSQRICTSSPGFMEESVASGT